MLRVHIKKYQLFFFFIGIHKTVMIPTTEKWHWTFYYGSKTYWNDAQEFCRSRNARLLKLNDATRTEVLRHYRDNNDYWSTQWDHLWSGLYFNGTTILWDGECDDALLPSQYTYWDNEVLNSAKPCTKIDKNNLDWKDEECNHVFYAVCEEYLGKCTFEDNPSECPDRREADNIVVNSLEECKQKCRTLLNNNHECWAITYSQTANTCYGSFGVNPYEFITVQRSCSSDEISSYKVCFNVQGLLTEICSSSIRCKKYFCGLFQAIDCRIPLEFHPSLYKRSLDNTAIAQTHNIQTVLSDLSCGLNLSVTDTTTSSDTTILTTQTTEPSTTKTITTIETSTITTEPATTTKTITTIEGSTKTTAPSTTTKPSTTKTITTTETSKRTTEPSPTPLDVTTESAKTTVQVQSTTQTSQTTSDIVTTNGQTSLESTLKEETTSLGTSTIPSQSSNPSGSTTTEDTTQRPQCVCTCYNSTKTLEERLIQLKNELTIQKKTTTKNKLKLISSPDDRTSAKGVGVLGIALLIGVMVSLILIDSINCCQRKKMGPKARCVSVS